MADALRAGLVRALIRRAIDPFFPPDVASPKEEGAEVASAAAMAHARREDFECLWTAPV